MTEFSAEQTAVLAAQLESAIRDMIQYFGAGLRDADGALTRSHALALGRARYTVTVRLELEDASWVAVKLSPTLPDFAPFIQTVRSLNLMDATYGLLGVFAHFPLS